MENKRRVLFTAAAPLTFLLIVVPFLFNDLFSGNLVPFDLWMQHLPGSQTSFDSNGVSKRVEEQKKPLNSRLGRLVAGKDRKMLEDTGFACDVAENSIVCVADQTVKIDTSHNITVYDSSSRMRQRETSVKPYALQKDKYLLQYITPVKIIHRSTDPPVCEYNHEIPAVIFSSGIAGNLFHEFNDIIIPLFLTAKHFQSQVLFILEDYNAGFVSKYSKIISELSHYQVMNPASNRTVHCFPGLVLGLKYHDNLALKPSDIPGGYSMHDFRVFLRETYGLKFRHVIQIRKPTLMLLSREKTRRFLNEDDIVAMIKGLGFRVIVAGPAEASNINKFADAVNSCSVLVGVHGAGLTNELFLPAGAVMVQVELLGLEWPSANYYGNPARAMGVHYLRYKIEPEESSLVELYGRNHSIITDLGSVYAKGYRAFREVYLDKQNARVNILKFRETLLQALRLVQSTSLAG